MYAHTKHQYFAVYRFSLNSITVRSGSTFSNSGGTIHNATTILIDEKYDSNTEDFGVALVQVCISFNESIYNEICITVHTCFDN